MTSEQIKKDIEAIEQCRCIVGVRELVTALLGRWRREYAEKRTEEMGESHIGRTMAHDAMWGGKRIAPSGTHCKFGADGKLYECELDDRDYWGTSLTTVVLFDVGTGDPSDAGVMECMFSFDKWK